MLTNFLSWVIAIVVGVAVVCFAIANREPVSLGFWPLVQELTLPLYLPVLAFGFIGFIIGGLIAWLSQARWRRLARRRARDVQGLERRVEALESRPPAPSGENRPGLPAAPPALRQVGGRG